MEWIEYSGNKPNRSIISNLRNLNLNDWLDRATSDGQGQAGNIKTFSFFSLKSLLQKEFKDQFFCQDDQEEGIQQSSNEQFFKSFHIMQETPYESYNIIITVQINLKLEFIRYCSFPLKSNQMLSFNLEQTNSMSRLISLYLNAKLPLGCLSINPESGLLNYQVVNNSLGHLRRRIHKAPNQLAKNIETEVGQIEKAWRIIFPSIFYLLDVNEKRTKTHLFWKNYKQKKNLFETDDYSLLSEYIKQSYIEYPFMFDEQIRGEGQARQVKRIRSRFLSREEKIKKKIVYEKMIQMKNYHSTRLTTDFSTTLTIVSTLDQINSQAEKRNRSISTVKQEELSKQLIVSNFESKTSVYSEIQIQIIRREQPLTRSNFSQLKLLWILAKKREDEQPTENVIVSKTTQPQRLINQTEILKIIGEGKSLFVTRYYFSPNQESKILLQYCPQKSIDAYLLSHKKFISLETKLFFMYQISIGLRFLRDFTVVHNDIKPQNILLKIVSDRNRNNGTFLLRLIDFGQSHSHLQRAMNSDNHYRRGYTIPYASPELTLNDRFTEKSDIFSFGVMLYEIIFDAMPAELLRKGREFYMNDEQYLKFYAMLPEKCRYYSLPKMMQLIYQLCFRCLSPRALERPSIDWIYIALKQILSFAEKIYSF